MSRRVVPPKLSPSSRPLAAGGKRGASPVRKTVIDAERLARNPPANNVLRLTEDPCWVPGAADAIRAMSDKQVGCRLGGALWRR
jgi:hypothetical protein